MSQNKDMVINRLPALTWNHLGMNQSEIRDIPLPDAGTLLAEVPDVILHSTDNVKRLKDIATGCGSAVDDLLEQTDIPSNRFKTKAGETCEKPVRLDFRYGETPKNFNYVELTARENSAMTVVMDYRSAPGSAGFAGVQTKIRAEKNSLVRLVQVHRLGENMTFINDIGTEIGDGARFELIQLILGCGRTYEGMRTDLNGTGACLAMDTAYIVGGTQRLDMNYAVNHIGRRTLSEINASGVLRDRAFKLFRGTIDLRKGASGAKGNEKEDVLLLDDTVINQTIPLILCDEEDVEGNHGATIGKLDDELLFYMQSRGIPQDAIYEMLATAHVEALLEKVTDEKTKCRVRDFLKGESCHD